MKSLSLPVKGMGIPEGFTLIFGGGFHGKSISQANRGSIPIAGKSPQNSKNLQAQPLKSGQ
ncbi:MAG: ABC-ATPase domain-containing protein [Tepidanaerobacteraceae bacterium]|nr:ABC-ATPase domain-containing protein [Tepidanaerobacteraceae bacterium]